MRSRATRVRRRHAISTAPEQFKLPSDPAVWIEVIQRLVELGWLLWGGKVPAIPKSKVPIEAKRALERFQRWAGLKADGVPGPITLHHLRQPRWCGTPDAQGAGQVCRWPQLDVTWNIAGSLPGVADADFRDAIQWATEQWNAVCGVRFAYGANAKTINVLLTVANLGGPGGVLADQQLPCGASATAQLIGRYDTSELWYAGELPGPNGRIPLGLTGLHELGHAIGLSHHAPGGTPAVMDPTLNVALRGLQPWDIAEAQSRYGQASGPLPPPGAGAWQISEQSDNLLKLERRQLALFTGHAA